MKNKLKTLLLLSCAIIGSRGMAGSSSGTGPPSKEQLAQLLMSMETGPGAGLFLDDSGKVALGINRILHPSLVLTRSTSTGESFSISEVDFDVLSNSKKFNIDAMTIGTQDVASRSYAVEHGENPGELVLKDRRQMMRNSVK